MVRECKESGLTEKNWCAEHVYYYRLRKFRQAVCGALQQAQPVQSAETPLAPKETEFQTQLRLTTQASAVIYSLVETAKADKRKIYEYLKHLLIQIPKHMDDTSLDFP